MKVERLPSNIPAQDNSTVRAALMDLQSALLELYGSHAPALLLYGSYARGDASSNSDVDVVLLYSGNIQAGREINRLREILSALNLRYQILISVLPVSSQHYRRAKTAFWKNVRREAVSVERI